MVDRRKTYETYETESEPTRTAVMYEVRYSTPDPCPHCGSRRKTVVPCLGPICTECFAQCQKVAEQEIEEENAAQAIPEAYELALTLYLERNLQ